VRIAEPHRSYRQLAMSSFVPLSQSTGETSPPNGADEDIHSPLNPFTLSLSHQSPQDLEFIPEKLKPGLEITFNPEVVCMKGTGPDVEPALLSGHVVLYLTESTSIREITLSFKGKARLPVASHEPSVGHSSFCWWAN
jgi:arrestin-related trafficking adapter 4/5/7